MKSMWRRALVVVVVTVGVTALLATAIAHPLVGLWLVVADPPRSSDAIAVLDGGTPARELEAAALYHRGLAPRVARSRGREPTPEVTRRLAGVGPGPERAAAVLMRVGVPPDAIVLLETVVENTEQELQVLFDHARARGHRSLILVTSPYHTRRVRLIWDRRYQRELPALVYPTSWDDTAPERWLRSRRSLEAVTHELVGIAHFLVGSPLPTYGSREGGSRPPPMPPPGRAPAEPARESGRSPALEVLPMGVAAHPCLPGDGGALGCDDAARGVSPARR